LEKSFGTVSLPCEKASFIVHFEQFFQQLNHYPFGGEGAIFMEDYAEGGMSSGRVSMKFWQEEGLPPLPSRIEKVQSEGVFHEWE